MSGARNRPRGGPAARERRGPRPWYLPRRSRRAQRWAALVVAAALAWGGWTLLGLYRDVVAYPDRPGSGSAEVVTVVIPPGSSFPRVMEILVDEGVVPAEEKALFKYYVLQEGVANKIAAGEHPLRGNMSAAEVVEELLKRPKVEQIRVTIPEGRHMLQVAKIFASAGLCDEAELVAAMRDRDLLDELGIEGPSVEGFLYPDTYQFDERSSAEDIVRRLVTQHRRVFDDLRRKHIKGARKLEEDFGWGDLEMVTLASIIEKETAAPEERPLISSVFQNRLRFDSFKPKYLATDPTIIYGCTVPVERSAACESFEGRIRTVHLRDKDNPYNTYTHVGLPPGPISNPGAAAIEAVFAPRTSRYLYFVSRNDGTHHFSATRREHEAMVDKYQRGGG